MNEPSTVRDGLAERLAAMIRIPTVSAELAERGPEPFEAFVALLEASYPLVHARLERERITDFGLLYRWRGTDPALAPAVLMAHYDVVPADEADGWTHPPFAGIIADGVVHGRGALDDKGELLVTIEAVENLLAAGFQPRRDVYLSFGGNEEVFGRAAREIADTLRSRGIVPWLVLDEGGAVVDAPLPWIKGSAAMVGTGEKGALTVLLSAAGEGGHASAPPELTAVGRVARALARITPSMFPPRMPKTIVAMLRTFVPHASGSTRLLLRVLAAFPWLTARILVSRGGESAAMVRTTVAPTMLSGGSAANVLPARAQATINLRIAPADSVESVVARIRRRVRDPLVEVTVVEGDEPSPESPVDDERFRRIAEAVAVAYPEAVTAPYLMMAASDARHFHRFSPAVYRFAPLAMSQAQRASIHGVDERVEIDSLERGERFYRHLIGSL